MTRWSYKVISYDHRALDDLGAEGRELVCVDGDCMVFKRPFLSDMGVKR